jgi:hypothetical protein
MLPQVDRVTRNAFKLFQVREQLKTTKVSVYIALMTCMPGS